MCMIKLTDILKEVQEGARVTFDDTGNASKIDIAYKHLDGEQLNSYSGVTSKNSYDVYYSLKSAPDQTNIKKSEDALKYKSQLIEPNELKDLIKGTVISNLPKIDYIGYLESRGGLNAALINTMKSLCGVSDENVIEIKKTEYVNIDDAVDWDSFNNQTKRVKDDIIKFLYKTAEKAPPYKITKSSGEEEEGGTQSIIVKRLYSKYNLGLTPGLKNKQLPPVYDVLVKCITQGKTLLIIDDNIHSGTDFYKIFKNVGNLVDKLKEENATPTADEEGAEEKLAAWRRDPRIKKSAHIQQEVERLEKILKTRRERIDIMNRSLNGSNKRIFGYVLYNLDPKDINK